MKSLFVMPFWFGYIPLQTRRGFVVAGAVYPFKPQLQIAFTMDAWLPRFCVYWSKG